MYRDNPGRVDDPLASGATLRSVLEEQQLMTAEVRQELDKGFEYWRMERLCCERLAQGGKVTLEEALQTSEVRCSFLATCAAVGLSHSSHFAQHRTLRVKASTIEFSTLSSMR